MPSACTTSVPSPIDGAAAQDLDVSGFRQDDGGGDSEDDAGGGQRGRGRAAEFSVSPERAEIESRIAITTKFASMAERP